MYEMEGPRLVSRHRPADFSASFAPLDRLPGPLTHPGLRLPASQVAKDFPLPGGDEFLRTGGPGLPPRSRREFPLRRVAQGAASGRDQEPCPLPGGFGCRPLAVTKSLARCLVARGARVLTGPGAAPCRWPRGCPRSRVAQAVPSPLAAGLPPQPRGAGSPLAGGFGASPGP